MKKNDTKKFDPFKNLVLDEEEQAIEDALVRGEITLAPPSEETKKMFKIAAEQLLELRSSKPITIRINQMDLIKVKAKAKRKNIPYQTLLGALIRDFADGNYQITI